MPALTRRRFVSRCATSAAGLWLLPPANAASGRARPSITFPLAPRERVAVASYPFREFIAGADRKPGNAPIELKDFAAHVVERFQVNRIEPWSAHFPSTDARYLADFRSAVMKAGSGVANIAVDGEQSPYASDAAQRERAVAFTKHWIDVAVAIGSPSIRSNIPQAKDARPDVTRLASILRQVAEYGALKNVVVHLENDNPVSEDPFFLVQVIEKVGSPWLRALPDFGNTLNAHDEDYAYRAIDVMFAHAYGICHVKDGEVNDQGKATRVNLAKTFGILKRHSYKGYCSIEYDAPGEPYEPTAKLVAETVQFLT